MINDIHIFKTIELKGSRTIDVLMVSNQKQRVFLYLYNYEGIHFRLFQSRKAIQDFFDGENTSYHEFLDDETLDDYLLNYLIA